MNEKDIALTDRERFYWQLQEKVRKIHPAFDIDAVRVAFAVLFTYNEMEARITTRLQKHSMTLPGFNALILLHHGKPEGHSLTELSQFLVSSRANITGVIDSLVRKGFVSREDHPNDRRVIMARITPAGRQWLQGYFPGHAQMMAGFSATLNKGEKQTLISLLAKMRAGILKSLPVIALSLISASGVQAEIPRFSFTLEQVTQATYQQSPELRAAEALAAAADDRARAEGGRLSPRLSIEGSARRVTEIPTLTLPTGQSLSLTDHESFSIGPSAQWTLFKGGGNLYAWRSAQAMARARRHQEQLIRRQRRLAARLAFFQTQLAAEQVRLLMESYNLEEDQHRDIQNRFAAGASSRMDLLLAHQQTLKRRRQLLEARADLASALREVTRLTGLGSQLNPSLPLDGQSAGERSKAIDVPTLYLDIAPARDTLAAFQPITREAFDTGQPGILFLTELAVASDRAARSLQGARWPELTLLARTSWDYPNGPIRETIHQNTIGATLSFPLFTGGQLYRQARAKSAEARAAEEDRDAQARDLLNTWLKARDRVIALRAQQALSDTTVREAQELARLQYQSYRAGRARYLDVEDANLKVLEARTDAARLDVQMLVQLATLESLSEERE